MDMASSTGQVEEAEGEGLGAGQLGVEALANRSDAESCYCRELYRRRICMTA